MKTPALVFTIALGASPAFAQLGNLGDIQRRVGQAEQLHISDSEERQIGEAASARVRTEFGVLQDPAVAKYVSLLGSVLAKASARPNLNWEFIVLDTEGVNAFAAPGGLVHITKGALGLMKSEAELAGVLGHEIAHITKKHTVNAIGKSNLVKLGTEEAGGRTAAWYRSAADAVYDNIFEKGFDRGDENDADQEGVRLANKAGYEPGGLSAFLQKLADRNKDVKGASGPNGLFATHPQTQDRIEKVSRQIKSEKLSAKASGAARYAQNVKFTARPVAEIVLTDADAKGLTGGGSAKKETKEPAKEPEKKSGGMFGGLRNKLSGSKQQEGTQASAAGASRAVDPNRPDRYAKGGSNPNKISVTVTAGEIESFKKGIA